MGSFRYEKKFLIPRDCYYEIRLLLKLHPANFSPVYNPRRVNNIYFDAYDWRFHNATVDGETRRIKIRIRWYGPLLGEIQNPVLELKQKIGFIGKKESYPLAPFLLDEHFDKKSMRDLFNASKLPHSLRSDLFHLECKLLNSYSREYFLSQNGDFRITLDSDTEFFRINSHKNTFSHRQRELSSIVMELKYDPDKSREADRITNHFPYRVARNSKYTNGIEALYL